jgi:hypothetical protein
LGNHSKYIILLFIAVILVSIGYFNFKQDDAFIFFTYAKNISNGEGYVFNQNEKINATTSPLYTLLLASFNFLTGPDNSKIPLIGGIIGIFSLCIFLFYSLKLLRNYNFTAAGYIFPFLILANPLIRNAAGMEIYLSLMFGMMTFYYYLNNQFELAALAGSLAVLARYDNILLISILFIDYILSFKKLPGIKSTLIFLGIVLLWFLFSYFYFGNFLPSTFAVKSQQEELGFWGKGWIFLKGFPSAFPGGKLTFFIESVIFITGIIKILLFDRELFRQKFFLLILIWTILYFICYSFLLNPPSYHWYFTFFTVLFGLVVSLSLEKVFSKLRKEFLFILTLFFSSLVLPLRTYLQPESYRYKIYTETAKWLNLNAAPGSKVAIDEIGIFGFYYNKGKVIDLLGLINPEGLRFLRKKNFFNLISYYKPDYLIIDYPERPVYEQFVSGNNFKNLYLSLTVISAENKSVQIFTKK